jgi:hypothetical protein
LAGAVLAVFLVVVVADLVFMVFGAFGVAVGMVVPYGDRGWTKQDSSIHPDERKNTPRRLSPQVRAQHFLCRYPPDSPRFAGKSGLSSRCSFHLFRSVT